jgi:hypothetical protein
MNANFEAKAFINLPDSSENKIRESLVNKIEIPINVNKTACNAWSTEFFSFKQSSLYQKLNVQQKEKLLSLACKSLLHEAYFIEKVGIGIASKMVLNATCTEEAQIYALMGADEAKHLQIFKNYIATEDLALNKFTSTQSFLGLLSRILTECSNNQLIYLIQIILEGWGLHHYGSLMKACQQANLRVHLQAILKDEALHHGAGLLLFNFKQLSLQETNGIKNYLNELFIMVSAGETYLLNCFERASGTPLSQGDKRRFLDEINSGTKTQAKLNILLNLIKQTKMSALVQELADNYLS